MLEGEFDELNVTNEKEGYFHRGLIRSIEIVGNEIYTHLSDHESKSQGTDWRKDERLLCTTTLSHYKVSEGEDYVKMHCERSGETVLFLKPRGNVVSFLKR